MQVRLHEEFIFAELSRVEWNQSTLLGFSIKSSKAFQLTGDLPHVAEGEWVIEPNPASWVEPRSAIKSTVIAIIEEFKVLLVHRSPRVEHRLPHTPNPIVTLIFNHKLASLPNSNLRCFLDQFQCCIIDILAWAALDSRCQIALRIESLLRRKFGLVHTRDDRDRCQN